MTDSVLTRLCAITTGLRNIWKGELLRFDCAHFFSIHEPGTKAVRRCIWDGLSINGVHCQSVWMREFLRQGVKTYFILRIRLRNSKACQCCRDLSFRTPNIAQLRKKRDSYQKVQEERNPLAIILYGRFRVGSGRRYLFRSRSRQKRLGNTFMSWNVQRAPVTSKVESRWQR